MGGNVVLARGAGFSLAPLQPEGVVGVGRCWSVYLHIVLYCGKLEMLPQ